MSESTKIVSADGTTEYRNAEGELHRVDGPALIFADGSQRWYKNGLNHREDGPAVIWADGYKAWYKNGRIHREDGPAKIWADGCQEWWVNGELHREDGPACIEANGSQFWYQNGRLHREDGPAIIWANGEQSWYLVDIAVSKRFVMTLYSLTADLIHKKKNAELRAWLINRMGWANYIIEINAQPIDSRSNDIENTKEALYKVKGIKGKQLVVTCPTGRVFSLHVPNNIKTCAEAQRWLGNDTKKKYNVIGRT